MARTPMVAGNWKMNTSADSARDLIRAIRDGGIDQVRGVEKVVYPPFVFLSLVAEAAKGSSIKVGAQNMHWEEAGAFTGEVSPLMVKGFAEFVLIGHSERRQYFGETDETVNRKLCSAIRLELTPVVCVGETGPQRDAGETEAVLRRQVRGGLEGAGVSATTVIAYEPVWAIGTGVAATAADAQAATSFIRAELGRIIGAQIANDVRILYGGSVTPVNIAEFVSMPDVDGGLVGGASLVASAFLEMVRRVGALRS